MLDQRRQTECIAIFCALLVNIAHPLYEIWLRSELNRLCSSFMLHKTESRRACAMAQCVQLFMEKKCQQIVRIP